jgi:hypothetical protein
MKDLTDRRLSRSIRVRLSSIIIFFLLPPGRGFHLSCHIVWYVALRYETLVFAVGHEIRVGGLVTSRRMLPDTATPPETKGRLNAVEL